MLPKEILKKIRDVEIKADRLSSSVMVGKHLSTFKGNGIDFSDLREYQYGDDIRSIAWRQTVRRGHAYVKNYVEERNLNIITMLDISSSGNYGSRDPFNGEAAAELTATLAMSAMKSGDNSGTILFTDDVELFIPPRKGPLHISRIIREILYYKPKSKKTDIRNVINKTNQMLTKSAQVFLITDIWSDIECPEIKAFSMKHDLNVITLYDSSERRLYDIGNLEVFDLETSDNIIVNTSSKQLRKEYEKEMNRCFEKRRQFLNKLGIRHSMINNQSNIFLEIIKFYSMKKRN